MSCKASNGRLVTGETRLPAWFDSESIWSPINVAGDRYDRASHTHRVTHTAHPNNITHPCLHLESLDRVGRPLQSHQLILTRRVCRREHDLLGPGSHDVLLTCC